MLISMWFHAGEAAQGGKVSLVAAGLGVARARRRRCHRPRKSPAHRRPDWPTRFAPDLYIICLDLSSHGAILAGVDHRATWPTSTPPAELDTVEPAAAR
jgi:hypothetical protein